MRVTAESGQVLSDPPGASGLGIWKVVPRQMPSTLCLAAPARHRIDGAGAPLQLIPEEGESSVEESPEATTSMLSQAGDSQKDTVAAGSRPSPAIWAWPRSKENRPPADSNAKTKAPSHKALAAGHWVLDQVSESRVLATGLRWLHEEVVTNGPQLELLDLPTRPDGKLKVIQASFLRRLLQGALELKGCLESDVSAAQWDLRQLSLEQLLCLRVQNLDFHTASESHSAHNNFLDALEAHLCERLAQRVLEHVATPSALRLLGRKFLLVLGAVALLREGWGTSCGALPDNWALELEPSAWQGYCAVLFKPRHLSALLVGEAKDWVQAVGPGQVVAVVCDRTGGGTTNRRLQWEISGLDPGKADIAAACRNKGGMSTQSELAKAIAAKVSPTGAARLHEDAVRAVPRPLRSGQVRPRPPRKSLEALAGKVRASVARIDRGL
mmetsp:Transcript_28594/g.64459  ORF Transcript_28594/g.64459 Transcript_28594/m.64459 type:complete len:440 (-) Transcript_28594:150-1469(-)